MREIDRRFERTITRSIEAPALALNGATAVGKGAVVGWLCCAVGCGDPVVDDAVDRLGPENPGVALGPLHRPGQPCLTCHDDATARAFAVAGTVYGFANDPRPAPATQVNMVDGLGRRFQALTNCAGNFFVAPEVFSPTFPVWVTLRRQDWEIAMDTPIHGEGSCAGCHTLDISPSSPGQVYLFSFDQPLLTDGCP